MAVRTMSERQSFRSRFVRLAVDNQGCGFVLSTSFPTHIAIVFLLLLPGVIPPPHGLGCECRDKESNAHQVLGRAHIVEEKKTQKERRRFAGCARNRHSKCAKVFGNGGRTRRPEKAHGRKQNHYENLARDRPSALVERRPVQKLLIGARLRHPHHASVQIALDSGGGRNRNQGDGVQAENELRIQQSKKTKGRTGV